MNKSAVGGQKDLEYLNFRMLGKTIEQMYHDSALSQIREREIIRLK